MSNSPSFEDAAVLEFFETSTRNILDAEAAAGAGHHVALSVVGTERMAESGYIEGEDRAREAHQELVDPLHHRPRDAVLQFAVRTADEASDGDTVRVPPVLIQPMAAGEVAAAVCNVTLAAPLDSTIERAGPQPLRFEDFVRRGLRSAGDQHVVVADPQARYFGARLSERSLCRVTALSSGQPDSTTGSASRHQVGDHVR